MKRKLGINSDCCRGFPETEMLGMIRDAGFETVFTGAWLPGEVEPLRKGCDRQGLDLEFIHAPFKGINQMWLAEEDPEIFKNLLLSVDTASDNGIPILVTHISSTWKPPEINPVGQARFDRLVEHAKEKNVMIAFENLRVVGNVAYFGDRYYDEKHVRFCYDCGHEHCFTRTVPWMDIFAERVVTTHIHDNFGIGKERKAGTDLHLLPFDGDFDYTRMIRKLDEYEYTGTLMLEVCNDTRVDYEKLTPREFLGTAYQRVKRISEL